jgi:hypothetical protein
VAIVYTYPSRYLTLLHVLTLTTHQKQAMMGDGDTHPFLTFCGIASGVLICVGLMCVVRPDEQDRRSINHSVTVLNL